MSYQDTRFLPPLPHYYLWHLVALGVIEADFGPAGPGELPKLDAPTITGTVWDGIAKKYPGASSPARVAMIDIGIAADHPNLASRIDKANSIDLVSHPFGAKVAPTAGATPFDAEETAQHFAGLSASGLDMSALAPAEQAYLDAEITILSQSKGVVRRLVNNEGAFASHGTAVAGLVVGEPAIELAGTGPGDVSILHDDTTEPMPGANRNLLPYFGVDPFSQLISIKTAFEQDPNHFIAAFLYAWKCQADVILLPRGLPDPVRGRLASKPELRDDLDDPRNWERADLYARLEEATPPGSEVRPHAVGKRAPSETAWSTLEKLILAISKQIPVICAAGNDGESQLIYPAKLAAPENGIVAVGAVTLRGYRSGYSNYGAGLTLVAPSDDGEVYNRHQMRLDRTDPVIDEHFFYRGTGAAIPYSEFSLLTTDVPGALGYVEGAEPYSLIAPPLDNPGIGGGYYTSFGGTSGAAALVAGVAALLARANKARNGGAARLDGTACKTLLVNASNRNAAVRPGTQALEPDPMNADGEASKGKSYYFGAGLLSASDAVAALLAS